MKINKDLTEACLMVGLICLVLTGTSDFSSTTTKEIVIGVLSAVNLGLAGLRLKANKQGGKDREDVFTN